MLFWCTQPLNVAEIGPFIYRRHERRFAFQSGRPLRSVHVADSLECADPTSLLYCTGYWGAWGRPSDLTTTPHSAVFKTWVSYEPVVGSVELIDGNTVTVYQYVVTACHACIPYSESITLCMGM